MDARQNEIEGVMARILGEDYLTLKLLSHEAFEDAEKNHCKITCQIRYENSSEIIQVEGIGVGMVDAFFNGLQDFLARDFSSLKTIRFADLSVRSRPGSGQAPSGSDTSAEVLLRIENSDGKSFPFLHVSPSISHSSLQVVLSAVEYFVNAERAFVSIYHAYLDAKERGRSDLVQTYADDLAVLVGNTSYTEVIDQIKKEMGF